MAKKIFLMCLMTLLVVQAATEAKGLAEEERIKVAVEISDTSRHTELDTAQILERCLGEELLKKDLLNVVGSKSPEVSRDEGASTAMNLGELLVFDAVELPNATEPPEDFDAAFYQEAGASYVIRCEVLALGLTKVEDNTLSTISTIVGTGLEFASKESVQYVGTGIGALGFIRTKRTALNTVVNMQFIDVTTSKVLWQENFIGQAVKHRKPGKNFDDAWTRALNESVADTARRIGKRVNKYVERVVVKGKSDKSFAPKGVSIGGGLIGRKTF